MLDEMGEQPPRKPGRHVKQDQKARELAQRELEGFNPRESEPYKEFRRCFDEELSVAETRSFARKCSAESGVRLPRDFARSKRLLLKWFVNHWETLKPYFSRISLIDEDGNELNKNVSLKK
jgi:hypothetical protein